MIFALALTGIGSSVPGAMAQPAEAAGVGAQTLRCESGDGRGRHCAVDTHGGVNLVRQLSRTACIEGRNWGYDVRGVWVEGGCRADLEAGSRAH